MRRPGLPGRAVRRRRSQPVSSSDVVHLPGYFVAKDLKAERLLRLRSAYSNRWPHTIPTRFMSYGLSDERYGRSRVGAVQDRGIRFDSFGISHPGRVRELNEDRYLMVPRSGLWLVADGMGGHDAGEVASSSIVEHLSTLGVASSAPDLRARFEDRIARANAADTTDRNRARRRDDRLDRGCAADVRAALRLYLAWRQPRLSCARRCDHASCRTIIRRFRNWWIAAC